MPGVYIHIPYCRTKCDYCNFFSIASQRGISEISEVICQEAILRRDYLGNKPASTVYFGGGTPSLLEPAEIEKILSQIKHTFGIEPEAEITLEANPDDLNREKIKDLIRAGVNRLSIGIQSFLPDDLAYLSRKHDPGQAIRSIEWALESGITNLSVDLIFGIPNQDLDALEKNLVIFWSYKIPHLSAYALTVEPKTALSVKISKGSLQPVDEELQASHFLYLMDWMELKGYLQYEISNFCLPGYESKHNSSYWSGEPYIGLGPSAHSFDGNSRQWNIANLSLYLNGIKTGKPDFGRETLTQVQKHNEYLMTAIRTDKGIDMQFYAAKFGEDSLVRLRKNVMALRKPLASVFPDQNNHTWIVEMGGFIRLTKYGRLFADHITSSLFGLG